MRTNLNELLLDIDEAIDVNAGFEEILATNHNAVLKEVTESTGKYVGFNYKSVHKDIDIVLPGELVFFDNSLNETDPFFISISKYSIFNENIKTVLDNLGQRTVMQFKDFNGRSAFFDFISYEYLQDISGNYYYKLSIKGIESNTNYAYQTGDSYDSVISFFQKDFYNEVQEIKLNPFNFISVNHNNVIFSNNIVSGICVGNSIMQGSGSSNINNTIPWILGSKLQSHFGTGTVSNWTPKNVGVGGSSTSTSAQYLSNFYDTENLHLGKFINSKKGTYCIMLTLRNDLAVFSGSEDKTRDLLNIMITSCKINNIQPVLVVDPPKVNMITGINEDLNNNFNDFYKVALNSAYKNGATVVDCWSYFEELNKQGVDLRNFTNDGTHPNDAGYEIISELIFKALIKQDKNANQKQFFSNNELVSVYEASSGSVTVATDFTGLTTSSTARKEETEESTNKAFQLADGDTIQFNNDSPCKGVLITLIGGGVGSLTGTYGYVSLGPSFGSTSSITREFTHFVKFSTAFAAYNNIGNLVLTSSGNVKITGVTFINERFSHKQEKLYGLTGIGTVTEGNLPNGKLSQILSNDSDYLEFDIYGSFFSFLCEIADNKGKFTYQVDGGATTEINCYLNASPTQSRIIIELGETGWHKVRITVISKDSSSSASAIEIGDFKKYVKETDAGIDFIDLENNTPIDLRKNYYEVTKAIDFSGNGIIYKSLTNNLLTKEGVSETRVKLK